MPDQTENVPEALQKQMDALTQAPQDGTPAPTTEATDTPPTETTPAPTETPQNTEAPAPAPQEAPKPAPVEDDPNSESYQQRYKVIAGKYNAETRQLRQSVQEKDAELALLRQELKAKSQQPPPQQQPPQPQAKPFDLDATMASITDDEVESLISEQDIEDYGVEYWKQILGVQRMGQNQAAGQSQQLPQQPIPDEFTQRLDYLEQSQRMQQDQAFFADLSALTPNWEQTETEDGFMQWKDEVEPMSGKTYAELIEDAYYAHDPLRTAALFDQYAATRPSAPPPAPGHTIESQVVPPTGGAPPPVQADANTMPLDQWNQAMKELTKGNMTPERVAERHKELVAMARAGRVTAPAQPMQGVW